MFKKKTTEKAYSGQEVVENIQKKTISVLQRLRAAAI